jgi:hypothetical protein
MDYLNGLNDEYWNGEADYNWSGYSDNCVHTLHNALAAAGVWKPKSVRAARMEQLFHLAVPANSVVDLAYLASQYPVEDFNHVRGDVLRWHTLTDDAWLPTTPGALMKILPVLQVNALYDTKFRMFVLGGWFRNDSLKRAQQLLTDGRILQLQANLRYFFERYEQILNERDEDPGWLDALRGDPQGPDRKTYYAYIEAQRDGVLRGLAELARLDALRQELIDEAREEWQRRVGPRAAP